MALGINFSVHPLNLKYLPNQWLDSYWGFDIGFKMQKKNTYALKTPSVVALPFIYGVEYIIISNQKKRKNNYYTQCQTYYTHR